MLSSARLVARILAAAASVIAVLLFAATAGAATVRFDPIASEQTFQVPLGVTSIHVVAVGAPGGRGGAFGSSVPSLGGLGAVVTSNLAVTPGEVLYVEVGAAGTDGNAIEEEGVYEAFNGGGGGPSSAVVGGAGGGGGGASDLRTIPLAQAGTLQSRLLVAAGGGGGGGAPSSTVGGVGGAAGVEGGDGPGAGGGAGGGEGVATAGGAKGSSDAGDGTLGHGGEGSLFAGMAGAGGGGGGGLYGGGGGGGSTGTNRGGGGGGGGSSAGGVVTADTTGKPSITISYEPFLAPPPATGGGTGTGTGTGTGGGNPPTTVSPVPQTSLDGHPPKVVVTKKATARVKFRFSADVVRPTFLCKIDGKPFAACTSPKRYSLEPGAHKFKVKAVKGSAVDASPAVFAFTIKRER